MKMKTKFILASGCKYRQRQLNDIGLNFTCALPEIDEKPLQNENPSELALRLSHLKGETVIYRDLPVSELCASKSDYIVISGDQVATCDGEIFDKSKNKEEALYQITQAVEHGITYHSAVSVFCVQGNDFSYQTTCVDTRGDLIPLTEEEIFYYVDNFFALDCCAGISLQNRIGLSIFKSIHSIDPSAILGLPIIKLCEMLKSCDNLFGVSHFEIFGNKGMSHELKR